MPLTVAHLTSTSSFGGPERQMLGLAESLPPAYRTIFLLFNEWGLCRPFAEEIRRRGLEIELIGPPDRRLGPIAAVRELARRLRDRGVDVLCSHGYKSNLLGFP